MTRPVSRLGTRFLGLVATLGLLVALAGVPLLLLAIDAVPDPATFAWSNLMRPDDGTLALGAAQGAVWILWLLFTVSVVVEVVAHVRHLRAPRLPGLAVPQLAVGRLVGLAALLFVAIPSVAAVTAAPRAVAIGVEPPPAEPSHAAATPTAPEPVAPPVVVPIARTDSYTVQRGDSLWKIANDHLGDGARYAEISDLNRQILGDDPDFILPGTVLQVPHIELDEAMYVVQPGDTLSEIAQDELGAATAWPEIADASRSITQPDGEHLADPDLIRPGWNLTIPSGRTTHDSNPKHLHRVTHEPPVPVAPPTPVTPTAEPTPGASSSAESNSASTDDAGGEIPAWLVPGLTGSGAALAGAALLVLRQHRRTQQRFRRPGQMIAKTPPDLLPFEKTLHAGGTVVAPKIEVLDGALRQLAHAGAPAPYIVFLSPTSITLHLTEIADLPAPWTGSGVGWTADIDALGTDRPDAVAPYPLLVSLGIADDGAFVYLNLESDPSLAVTGDAERAVALGRHIAAELALNPWSSLVEIEAFGIGEELADIDPSRLHHHSAADDAFVAHLATTLEATARDCEPDRYRAVITTTDSVASEGRELLSKVISNAGARLGAVLIGVNTEQEPAATPLRIAPTGRLSIGSLELTAAGLSAEAARGCALLVDLTRDTESVPIPIDPTTERIADMAGALVPELTEPREGNGATGNASLLPEDDTTYEAAAAITSADVGTVAPKAITEAAAIVAASDPHLDADLAYWHDGTITRPKLHLLGPVHARTSGSLSDQPYRRPFRTEMLTLLFLHPAGLTIAQIREALNNGSRAHKDVSLLRQWLGGPDEEHLYLPSAQTNGPDRGIYRVRNTVCDLDLFRRLRARGQSRGCDGIADLRSALELVAGEPFSDLRNPGWSWLLEGERHDHIITASIVDTAHIVTTHALAIGDLELAAFAAEKGYLAAKYDETACLDMIAVEKALGHDDAAERIMQNEVLDRADDDLGPMEPPETTTRIIRQRGWERTQRTG